MEVDIGMVDPAMLTGETGGSAENGERCLVANQMASDLSGFSARPLRLNQ